MIAFCTTCKGRAQHIKQTLPRNLADNADFADLKFIILDYGSPDDLIAYLGEHHAKEIASGRLALYRHWQPGPFHMAHAKNMAHRLGILEGASILVNVDADNFTGPGFARYVARQFHDKRNIFLWAKMVKEGPDRLPRGISGRIAVTSHAFLNAGGYDEKYDTWAPDDKDFNLRLQRLGYAGEEIDRQFLNGVPHNEKMRFREYPHARANMGCYEFEAVHESGATIANYGNFGCGLVTQEVITRIWAPGAFDVRSRPIDLDPLPTRIFGIGMHKTATSSLHAALRILGFDSAHWKSAHWAKKIWREITHTDRSPTLERHYALSDLPITILYQRLDRAYPGSKFILTVRGEDRWLRSVRTHWDPAKNPFRSAWDADPFTHRIHKKLYGRTDFDADVFLERYRRHNAEVKEYFHARPADLLVMDMDGDRHDAGAGWPELCGFLRQPVPAVPYPWANSSRSR